MIHSISYKDSQQFSSTILDYLNKDDFFNQLINDFPSLEALQKKAQNRPFSSQHRKVLISALKNQYAQSQLDLPMSIEDLAKEGTVTITTGHQLNLFAGPLYSILKIASTINLCRQLNKGDKQKFVPVFWMATEDHDLDEINHCHVYRDTIQWPSDQSGAVGRMKTDGIEECIHQLKEILGVDRHIELYQILETAYQQTTLTEAHRYLVYHLFKGSDLLILDGDDVDLKTLFIPALKKDILENLTFQSVTEANTYLQTKYKTQAFVRPINVFYLEDGSRRRIEFQDHKFYVVEGDKTWTQEELLTEIEAHPENFSPNVLLRPLYQETILPNVAYIGGGGELAYWFQLKKNFDAYQASFPILILRKSLVFMREKDLQHLNQIDVELKDLFLDETSLSRQLVSDREAEFELSKELNDLSNVYQNIKERVASIDQSLQASVEGEIRKMEKSIEHLTAKVRKAQKRRHETVINKTLGIRNNILPQGKLQERHANFSQFYFKDGFIQQMIDVCDPLENTLSIVIQ